MKIINQLYDLNRKEALDRMDVFDAVVVEYLRASRKTVGDLCEMLGCDQSTLWRYRKKVEAFQKAPFDIICGCLRIAKVPDDILRFVCGV